MVFNLPNNDIYIEKENKDRQQVWQTDSEKDFFVKFMFQVQMLKFRY